jgi:hypothetical protein
MRQTFDTAISSVHRVWQREKVTLGQYSLVVINGLEASVPKFWEMSSDLEYQPKRRINAREKNRNGEQQLHPVYPG